MANLLHFACSQLLKRTAVLVARNRLMCSGGKELDKPVKFSSSKAATWKAEFSRRGDSKKPEDDIWFEPYVIVASVSCFLIYFCALREENDIDLALAVNLYSKLDGMDEFQLRAVLDYNRQRGIPTGLVETRLAELENAKR